MADKVKDLAWRIFSLLIITIVLFVFFFIALAASVRQMWKPIPKYRSNFYPKK